MQTLTALLRACGANLLCPHSVRTRGGGAITSCLCQVSAASCWRGGLSSQAVGALGTHQHAADGARGFEPGRIVTCLDDCRGTGTEQIDKVGVLC